MADIAEDVEELKKTVRDMKPEVESLGGKMKTAVDDMDGIRKLYLKLEDKMNSLPSAARSTVADQTDARKVKVSYVSGNDAKSFAEIRKLVGPPGDNKKNKNGNAPAEIYAIRYHTKDRDKAWAVITEHAIKIQQEGIRLPFMWLPEPMMPNEKFGEGSLVVVIKVFSEDGS